MIIDEKRLRDEAEYFSSFISVSRETHARFQTFSDLLIKWQEKINLISQNSISAIWSRHILDSAQLIPHIEKEKTILDLGSGAGFPGLILAMSETGHVSLAESDGRKTAFLMEAARQLAPSTNILTARIEKIAPKPYDIITSRALMALPELLDLASPFFHEQTICLFHKGKKSSMELDEAKEKWCFAEKILPSITDPTGVIIQLSNLSRRHNG